MSGETLTELSEVLSPYKFDRYVPRKDRQHFLRLFGGIVRVIPITQRIAACRDPRDDKFLDVALNGEASADQFQAVAGTGTVRAGWRVPTIG